MSTRQSIYHHEADETTPDIHIYREMIDDPPIDIRMEITLDGAVIDIILPVDLQARMGLIV